MLRPYNYFYLFIFLGFNNFMFLVLVLVFCRSKIMYSSVPAFRCSIVPVVDFWARVPCPMQAWLLSNMAHVSADEIRLIEI